MMKSNFAKRIAALEAKIYREPVILHFTDGSQRIIRGDNRHMFALMHAGMAMYDDDTNFLPDPDHPLCDELVALKNAVRIEEPARMFNLIWATLQGGIPRGSYNA